MEYPTDCDRLARVAANPDQMGGHGQPNGRPEKPPEERDTNHPKGTDSRAGLPGGHGVPDPNV